MSAGRNVNSQSQSWGTPLKYVKAVKNFMTFLLSTELLSILVI